MEQLPLIRAPNYLGEFAETMAEFDANSATRLKAELDARRGALGSILGNSERLAGLGGSGTIDQLLGSFTNMDQPLFDTDYARRIDELNLIGREADIAATNRSGAGGGGGGIGGMPKTDEMEIGFYDANGNLVNQRRIKSNTFDYYANNSPGLSVRILNMPEAGTGTPIAAPTQSIATERPQSPSVIQQQQQMLDDSGQFDTRITPDGQLEFKPIGAGENEWEPV